MLGKPADAAEAGRFLALLSGRRHRVIGGLCVIAPTGGAHERLSVTAVRFKRLAAEEIAAYLAAGEWHDKAGGYAIQGRAAALVAWIGGSYSNVVGLPLNETAMLLQGIGWRPAVADPAMPARARG